MHLSTSAPGSLPARSIPGVLGVTALAAALLSACEAPAPHTALGAAAAAGEFLEVAALLDHAGADPDAMGAAGLAPLHVAARGGDPRIVEALIGAGADLEMRDRKNGWTPLLHAIHMRNGAAVEDLLAAGADYEGRARGGITPLIMAAGYGMRDTVRLLLDRGADPRADMDGLTALWAAAGGGAIQDFTDGPPLGRCFPEVIELLRERAPDLRMGGALRSRVLGWLADDPCEPLVEDLVAETLAGP